MVKPSFEGLMIGASDQSDESAVDLTVETTAGAPVLPSDGPAAVAEDSVILDLADLLPDEAGDVVLFAGDDFAVNLLSDQPVTDAGVAEAHVTATGVDVTGLHYYAFENGITIYSQSDLQILSSAEIT